MSKSLFGSFQQMCDLNIKLVQTMLEETTLAGQQMLTAERPPAMLNAAASRAQPASEKLRAYQQHISKLAADAQVQLARVAEDHVQNTSRTAQAVAEEMARTANEETERGIRTQQETLRQFSDPFAQGGDRQQDATARPRGDGGAGAPMHSSGQQGMSQAGSRSMQQGEQQGGQGSMPQGGGMQGGTQQGTIHGDVSFQGQGGQGGQSRNP
jgi:phasin family protein